MKKIKLPKIIKASPKDPTPAWKWSIKVGWGNKSSC